MVTYYAYQMILFLLIIIITSFSIILLYTAFTYNMFQRIVDPSFDMWNYKRLGELVVSYYLFSILVIITFEFFTEHFASKPLPLSFQPIIPATIFLITRTMVRFHSSRVGKEYFNALTLLALASICMSVEFDFLRYFVNHESLDITIINVISPGNWKEYLIGGVLFAIIIPFMVDSILYYLPEKFEFVRKHFIKDKKLIDLTDKLPIKLETIIGEERIKEKIKTLIQSAKEGLEIISNRYSTIYDNSVPLSKYFSDSNVVVRIIGCEESDPQAVNRRKNLENMGIKICVVGFDGIRLIIVDKKKIILSFATAGYATSHIGMYSEHPLIISLFLNYFELKWKPYCETNDNA